MDQSTSIDVDFGSCCACGKSDRTVRNMIALKKRAPVPGTGWGCAQCGLPADGAMAVICDECLRRRRAIRWACKGVAQERLRVGIHTLECGFDHRRQFHPEVLSCD